MIDPKTGRVHTSYHQAVAATGRLSSTDPNLQNIPVRTAEGRRIRQAFIAENAAVLAADISAVPR
jgi:DNA polymerase-1